MPALASIFKKAYWTLAACGGLYAAVLFAGTYPTFQRHALYSHKVHTNFIQSVDQPEAFGFAKNQVTAFNITTPDGESLYAWHVLPLGVYAKHEEEILKQPSGPVADFAQTLGYKLLTEDPDSRIILNFHGNAGHLAQGRRPAIYRSLTSASTSPPLHILTLDYRGFGKSTGFPTETGLITDGIALASFALSLGIPSSRILLLGQSLGTAVATSVALSFAEPGSTLVVTDPRALREAAEAPVVDFAGLLLVCPFISIVRLLPEYRLGGVVPVLSPIRGYPRIQDYILSKMVDTWETRERLDALVKATVGPERKLNLGIIAAKDDWDIPASSSEELFKTAAEALGVSGKREVAVSGVRSQPRREEVRDGERVVELQILEFGGHNPIVAYAPVAVKVLKMFGIA